MHAPAQIKFYTLVIACLILGSCTTLATSNQSHYYKDPLDNDQTQRWQLLIGHWYGDQTTQEGDRRQWLITRHPDGTYIIKFRGTMANGQIEESTEVGEWGAAGTIYFTIFKGWLREGKLAPADPSDPYNYDAYQIISLDEERFEYTSVTTNTRFSVRRVTADFIFDSRMKL